MKHWAEQYIGIPWEAGAFGPDSFDCWGLVWHVAQTHFETGIPRYQGAHVLGHVQRAELMQEEVDKHFERIEKPFDGCFVGLGSTKGLFHVGIYLETDKGLVLHCFNKGRTVAESIRSLVDRGFSRIEFFKWLG